MALGKYKVPRKFKDEDKWFRFFTKKQLVIMGTAALVGLSILMCSIKIGVPYVGFFLLLLIVISAGVCAMFKIPDDKYLIGGGEYIGTILIRMLIKRLPWNRNIYIKNYDKILKKDGKYKWN